MSHFTVLVIGDDPEAQLAPFQENNMCDCPDGFLEFEDREDECHQEWFTGTRSMKKLPSGEVVCRWDERFQEPKEGIFKHAISSNDKFTFPEGTVDVEVPYTEVYPTFEEYMEEYEGYEARDTKTNRYGYWENPNAKWDWYQLGGRWKGTLKLREDAQHPEDAAHGETGLMGSHKNAGPLYVDRARKDDVDWAEMQREAQQKNDEDWAANEKAFGEYGGPEGFAEAYNSKSLQEGHTPHFSLDLQMIPLTEGEWRGPRRCETQEEFYKRRGFSCTFAVIKDGEWYERGEMGWFGCVSGEKDRAEWSKQYTDLLMEVDGDTIVSVYDCHI